MLLVQLVEPAMRRIAPRHDERIDLLARFRHSVAPARNFTLVR